MFFFSPVFSFFRIVRWVLLFLAMALTSFGPSPGRSLLYRLRLHNRRLICFFNSSRGPPMLTTSAFLPPLKEKKNVQTRAQTFSLRMYFATQAVESIRANNSPPFGFSTLQRVIGSILLIFSLFFFLLLLLMDYCIGFSATLPGYEMDRIKAQQDAINQLNSQSNFSELFLESLRIYKTAATKKGLSSSFFSCGCSHRRSYLSCYLVTTTTTTKLAPSHALLIGRQPSWLENTPTKSKSASA